MTETEIDIASFKYEYPKKAWVLRLVCHLWLLLVVSFFYYGRTSELLPGFYEILVIIYLFIVSIFIWDWPARLFHRYSPIIIHLREDGIQTNKSFVLWDDIKRIGNWPFLSRITSNVCLKLKRKKTGIFDVSNLFKPTGLNLPGLPFTYKEVLPAIHRIRPEIPISRSIARRMEQPDKVGAPRRWLVLILLILNITVLSLVLHTSYHSLNHYMLIGLILMFLTIASSIAIPMAKTAGESFILYSLQSLFLVGASIQLYTFSTAEYLAIKTLVITSIGTQILAVFVLFAKKVSRLGQIFIVVILVLVPVLIYQEGKSQMWPSEEITDLLGNEDFLMPFWEDSGTCLTNLSFKEEGYILEIPSLERKLLPKHKGTNAVVWFNNQYLILRVFEEDKSPELWVYDIAGDVEFKLPTSSKFSVGRQRPVCYKGQRLVWIDCSEDGSVDELRFWNLDTMEEDLSSHRLPAGLPWSRGEACWVGEGEVAVYVEACSGDRDTGRTRSFSMVRVALDGREDEFFTSSHEYNSWYPTMDFRYAFGVNRKELDRYSVFLVDLETDEVIGLPGDAFAYALPSSESAFRVIERGGDYYLVRFDFATGEDVLLHRVPKGMKLISISKTGQFAILGLECFSLPAYVVVHIPSGRQHRITLSGISGPSFEELNARTPAVSLFSPDERMFLLGPLQVEGEKILLYQIPDSW